MALGYVRDRVNIWRCYWCDREWAAGAGWIPACVCTPTNRWLSSAWSKTGLVKVSRA